MDYLISSEHETSQELPLYNQVITNRAAVEIALLYMDMTANLSERDELDMDFDIRDLPTKEMLQEFSKSVPEIDISATEAMLLFMRTASNIFKVSSNGFEKFDVSSGKFALLILLYRNQNTGLLASELAERAGITKATVTGLLERMERDHLIFRKDHPSDRRMSIAHLTDTGMTLMNELLPVHFLSTSKIMSGLSEEEKAMLLLLLEKIKLGIPEGEEVYNSYQIRHK
ncbi:MarR family winged helix-turn-helix transcriptional regulator [Paenibacillus nicotianae]|uniref:MarR family winged helix-turn-helix transcriptional regulator n=1 Tax=Paenibacillus nicotianae TaxID=1526551 RepID=A0ABW4UPC6_9BACL